MQTEPRPVDSRHAALGGILLAIGAYLGGGAVWSWLMWPDQHLDASRLLTLLFAWVAIIAGLTLIQRWLDGDWFEGRKWSGGDTSGSQGSSSSDGSNSCDAGGSGSDGGSCSS